jgi:PAS domain S-box-containing protein
MAKRSVLGRVFQNETRRPAWSLLIVLLVLTVAIGASGFLYYQAQKKDVMLEQSNRLQAIANLKAAEIRNWLDERMGNARAIETNPILTAELEKYLQDRSIAPRRDAIRAWMAALQLNFHYQNILLLDASGKVVLALDEVYPLIGSEGMKLMDEVRRQKKAILSDLHRSEKVSRTHMDAVVPLMAENTVDGFVFLRIDPADFLYPMIQSWPIPSPTAETLLVRREGDHVLFLNELRHRKGTAMTLSLPLSNAELPAARAVLGKTGAFAGRDYRGVPVWSTSRPITGTSWFIVAKVDREEIELPVRRAVQAVLLVILALGLSAVLLIMFLWQRRNALYRLRQLEAERQKQVLTQQLDNLTLHANDIILLCDELGNILQANERAMTAYGYDRETLLRMNLHGLRASGEKSKLAAQVQQVEEKLGLLFETMHQRKDGSTFAVEVNSRPILVEDKKYFQNIIRDISERKEAEAKLQRANRMYALRSQFNQAIVRARDRRRLFQDICDLAIEVGKFRMVWIGLVDGETRTVRPACRSGHVAGYLDHIAISIDDIPSGQGPTGTAIRENRLVFSNDIPGDEKMAPWRSDTSRRIYLSSAALPLRFQGKCIGALMLYADETGFFDANLVGLLEEVIGDLAFALDALENEARQRRAEEALQESELKFRALFETMSLGVVYQGADGKIIAANPAAENILGLTLEQMRGLTSLDPRWRAIHEDGSDFPGPTHPIPVAQRTGRAVENVTIGVFNPRQDGYRWVKVSAIPQFWPGENVPYQVFATFDDITDLIRSKKELETLSKRFERRG